MSIQPIKKSVEVRLKQEKAFQLFTREITQWWPLKTHSMGQKDAVRCVFEEKKNGRLYEVSSDGTETDWGKILVWEPHGRVVFSWHPGRASSTAQEVEIRFTKTENGTRVDLEHRNWDNYGEDALKVREDYDGGWNHALGTCYADAAAA